MMLGLPSGLSAVLSGVALAKPEALAAAEEGFPAACGWAPATQRGAVRAARLAPIALIKLRRFTRSPLTRGLPCTASASIEQVLPCVQ